MNHNCPVCESPRVPKPFYQDNFIVDFFVKNKQIHYKILKWNEDGTNLALLSKGEYHGEDPNILITKEIDGCGDLK